MSTHDSTPKRGNTNDLDSPLGIAGEPIAESAKDHLPPGDPSTKRSRARALGEDGIEQPVSGPNPDDSDGDANHGDRIEVSQKTTG